MVIHDMRNPTTAIRTGLQQVEINQREILKMYENHDKFRQKCQALNHKIEENK